MIKPTVGRVVYYKSRGSADGVFPKTDRAALITDVKYINGGGETVPFNEEHFNFASILAKVRLFVINPDGTMHTDWLDQGQEGGQWDWMPFQKDQQARMAPGTLDESHKLA